MLFWNTHQKNVKPLHTHTARYYVRVDTFRVLAIVGMCLSEVFENKQRFDRILYVCCCWYSVYTARFLLHVHISIADLCMAYQSGMEWLETCMYFVVHISQVNEQRDTQNSTAISNHNNIQSPSESSTKRTKQQQQCTHSMTAPPATQRIHTLHGPRERNESRKEK